MKKSIRIKPYFSKNPLISRNFSGKKAMSILEPSSGGIGTRLNMANNILIKTILAVIPIKAGLQLIETPNLSKRPNIKAKTRFEAGPAIATVASDHRPGLKLYGLYGTGLAQPKINPPNKYPIVGTTIEPIGSMCLTGFRVKRP